MRTKPLCLYLGAALLAGCASEPPLAPVTAPATPHLYAVRQADDSAASFVVCEIGRDCLAPTPKTRAYPVAHIAVADTRVALPPVAAPATSAPVVVAAPSASAAAATPVHGPSSEIIVHFATEQAALSWRAQAILQAHLPQFTTATEIVLYGRTDSIGPHGYNEHLASKRSLAVHDWLIAHGVDQRVVSFSQGRCCYSASNHTAAGRAVNRRVVVDINPESLGESHGHHE